MAELGDNLLIWQSDGCISQGERKACGGSRTGVCVWGGGTGSPLPPPVPTKAMLLEFALPCLSPRGARALVICVGPAESPSRGLVWQDSGQPRRDVAGVSAEEAESRWWSVTFSSQK